MVISGFMTQFCCVSSARSAHDRDYRTLFLSDGTGGPDLSDLGFGAWTHQQVKHVVMTALGHGVAEIISTQEFTSRIRNSFENSKAGDLNEANGTSG